MARFRNDVRIGVCRDCDADIYRYDDYSTLPNSEMICNFCYERNYFFCDNCLEVISLEEAYLEGFGDNGLDLCLNCATSKDFNICVSCLDPYPAKELVKGRLCEICQKMYEQEDIELEIK